jgi:hypothetical protein
MTLARPNEPTGPCPIELPCRLSQSMRVTGVTATRRLKNKPIHPMFLTPLSSSAESLNQKKKRSVTSKACRPQPSVRHRSRATAGRPSFAWPSGRSCNGNRGLAKTSRAHCHLPSAEFSGPVLLAIKSGSGVACRVNYHFNLQASISVARDAMLSSVHSQTLASRTQQYH